MGGRAGEAAVVVFPEGMDSISVGVDVGGTFTDVVTFDRRDGSISVLKVPTSREPASAVADSVRRILGRKATVSLISHATTIATNALLTHTGLAKTALVTNDGFRDVLEIGRQRRPELYDLHTRRPAPIVKRRDRLTVPCRMTHEGRELKPLDVGRAREVARLIVRRRFDSVAVSFLNSYANPKHERKMGRILRDEGFGAHVSLSSDVDREYREYERTSTAVVNAALAPKMSTYLSGLRANLSGMGVKSPLYIMTSDGGMSTVRSASIRPVAAIESGPAAGVLASKHLARRLALDRVLTFDMGGTTAKAGVVLRGEPDTTREFEAAGRTHSGRSVKGSGYSVRGRFIDLAEVSAGGGTIAWVDDGGALCVGPRSSGSRPGPACYGKGGTEPTVTDAHAVLGRLSSSRLLGGRIAIRPDLANTAVSGIARRLRLSTELTAEGVLRLANDSMARAMSIVSLERGRDPRDFTMVAFGGAGPMHCCDLADDLGIKDVLVPAHAGLFSAYGLLVSDFTRTFTAPGTGDALLAAHFEALSRLARREMAVDGFPEFAQQRFVEARYAGQSHELELPYTGAANLKRVFDRRHRGLYGYSSDDMVEVVTLTLRAVVRRSRVGRFHAPQRGGRGPERREAVIAGRRRVVDVQSREGMLLGQHGSGPCIIEEYDSTLVVNPSWRWRIEEYGTRLKR